VVVRFEGPGSEHMKQPTEEEIAKASGKIAIRFVKANGSEAQMKAAIVRLRRLENTLAPVEQDHAIVEAIISARRRRMGPNLSAAASRRSLLKD